MLFKDIEKQKCDNCPLIDVCNNTSKSTCLCCEKRLSEIDIQVYKECYFEEPYQNIRGMALQLGLEIAAPPGIDEHEQVVWEDEHNCLNNTKYAFMELFLLNPITCTYEEWNK